MDSLGKISVRLLEERNRLDESQLAFAAAGGVDPKTQRALRNRGSTPSVSYLVGIEQKGADLVYIPTGRRNDEPVPGHVVIQRLPASAMTTT